jgi:hypothetical protein
MAFRGHKKSDNTLLYVQLDEKLFKECSDNFITRVAHNAQEACTLVETGFEYVTGEYSDGGKSSAKENSFPLNGQGQEKPTSNVAGVR